MSLLVPGERSGGQRLGNLLRPPVSGGGRHPEGGLLWAPGIAGFLVKKKKKKMPASQCLSWPVGKAVLAPLKRSLDSSRGYRPFQALAPRGWESAVVRSARWAPRPGRGGAGVPSGQPERGPRVAWRGLLADGPGFEAPTQNRAAAVFPGFPHARSLKWG